MLSLCTPSTEAQVELAVSLGQRDQRLTIEGAGECGLALGGCFEVEGQLDDGSMFELSVVVPIGRNWNFEALLSQQSTALEGQIGLTFDPCTALPPGFPCILLPPAEPTVVPFQTEVDVRLLQVGILKPWSRGNWQPYVAGGLGLVEYRVAADLEGLGALDDLDGEFFAANAGGGVKYWFRPNVALRLDARAYHVQAPEGIQGSIAHVDAKIGMSMAF